MTGQTLPSSDTAVSPPRRGNWFSNLNIGRKLTLGFGILVSLTLAVTAVSYLGSASATQDINRVDDLRAPAALASSRAQENLLKMLSDVHVYLALGDQTYQDRYTKDRQAFQDTLAQMQALATDFDSTDMARFQQLQAAFEQWTPLPNQLFDLRNDQLQREPAYKILATDGLQLGGTILIDMRNLIAAQGRREPTQETLMQAVDLANFQASFAGMLAGLRSYVLTRNLVYRGEYEANLALTQSSWAKVQAGKASLTPSQQATLDLVAQNLAAFEKLPDPMFKILESPEWRTDLYLFSTKALPIANNMSQVLDEITVNQQAALSADLETGRTGLVRANASTLAGSLIALILGVVMGAIFQENIAGPVRRLTAVAERIRRGDLDAQADVESRDEIGILAETFNNMTRQLRQTLVQIRKEKKRADDLLGVVIPIGVQLAGETDFNRLLENILVEAKKFAHADAGSLFLRSDANSLRYVIVRNDTLETAQGGTTGEEITAPPVVLYSEENGEPNEANPAAAVALDGEPINAADVYAADEGAFADLKAFDAAQGYHHTSLLALPLKNSQQETIGVLQLANAEDPDTQQVVAFDDNLQQMMASLSSLAGVALEGYLREQALRVEIQQLRIEIDEVKREQQLSEIVDTDFFQDLQAKAGRMRERRARQAGGGLEHGGAEEDLDDEESRKAGEV